MMVKDPDQTKVVRMMILRGLDTYGRFGVICYKGDDFCDFFIAFLYTRPLLKKRSILQENIFLHGKQIVSVRVDLVFRREQTKF